MARVTVEDCLHQVDNLFELVLLASARARRLANGAEATVPLDNDKVTVIALREIAEGNITFTAGQNFAEAQTKIVTRTITRIREIPVYVTPKADAACAVPVGFIRLHDDAANDHQGATIPDAAGESLDSTSDAKLSEVSAAIVSNYGTYYQIREQLISLQNWVRQQQALHATEGAAQ